MLSSTNEDLTQNGNVAGVRLWRCDRSWLVVNTGTRRAPNTTHTPCRNSLSESVDCKFFFAEYRRVAKKKHQENGASKLVPERLHPVRQSAPVDPRLIYRHCSRLVLLRLHRAIMFLWVLAFFTWVTMNQHSLFALLVSQFSSRLPSNKVWCAPSTFCLFIYFLIINS